MLLEALEVLLEALDLFLASYRPNGPWKLTQNFTLHLTVLLKIQSLFRGARKKPFSVFCNLRMNHAVLRGVPTVSKRC